MLIKLLTCWFGFDHVFFWFWFTTRLLHRAFPHLSLLSPTKPQETKNLPHSNSNSSIRLVQNSLPAVKIQSFRSGPPHSREIDLTLPQSDQIPIQSPASFRQLQSPAVDRKHGVPIRRRDAAVAGVGGFPAGLLPREVRGGEEQPQGDGAG
jgi:hypothetical protein